MQVVRDCVCMYALELEAAAQTSVHLSPPGCVERVGHARCTEERRVGQTFDLLLSAFASWLLRCLLDPREKQRPN